MSSDYWRRLLSSFLPSRYFPHQIRFAGSGVKIWVGRLIEHQRLFFGLRYGFSLSRELSDSLLEKLFLQGVITLLKKSSRSAYIMYRKYVSFVKNTTIVNKARSPLALCVNVWLSVLVTHSLFSRLPNMLYNYYFYSCTMHPFHAKINKISQKKCYTI